MIFHGASSSVSNRTKRIPTICHQRRHRDRVQVSQAFPSSTSNYIYEESESEIQQQIKKGNIKIRS